jgi:hypothetical protein
MMMMMRLKLKSNLQSASSFIFREINIFDLDGRKGRDHV